jgi:hypothetical protein
MSKHLTHVLTFALGLSISAAAFAAPLIAARPDFKSLVQTVDADCYAVGEDKAAELGGTLAKAKPAMDGDTPVCQLVIVVPGQDGERPKRVELVVPQ